MIHSLLYSHFPHSHVHTFREIEASLLLPSSSSAGHKDAASRSMLHLVRLLQLTVLGEINRGGGVRLLQLTVLGEINRGGEYACCS